MLSFSSALADIDNDAGIIAFICIILVQIPLITGSLRVKILYLEKISLGFSARTLSVPGRYGISGVRSDVLSVPSMSGDLFGLVHSGVCPLIAGYAPVWQCP